MKKRHTIPKVRKRAAELFHAADKSDPESVYAKIAQLLALEGHIVKVVTLRSWAVRDGWVKPRQRAPREVQIKQKAIIADLTGEFITGHAVELDDFSAKVIKAADKIANAVLTQAGHIVISTPQDLMAMASALSTLTNAGLVASKAAAAIHEANAKIINGNGEVMHTNGRPSSLGTLAAYDN